MKPIFVKSRFHYDSYTDFWALVKLSGFEWCYIDEINLKSKNTYIITMVDAQRDKWHLSWWQKKQKNARLILWELERPKPRGGIEADRQYLARQRFDEIWVSDRTMAKNLRARFVILGSNERLGENPFWIKRYDFVPMGYINGRRGLVLENLNNIAPNSWGKQKQNVLRGSKFGLNIHQDNDLYGEPLRFALFASYELPVISETIIDSFPLDNYLLMCNYNNLIEVCRECLSNYKQLKQLGKEIKQKLCFDYSFKNVVNYAIV